MNTPNTKILYGKLKQSDLENFAKVWIELKLPIYGDHLQTSVESINNANKNLNGWPVKPEPHDHPYNKIIFLPRSHPDGNLYVHAKVHLGNDDVKTNQEMQKQYNKLLLKEYFLKE